MKIWVLRDFAYKGDFFIKAFSTIFSDLIMPITTIFIYASSKGIPGWSLEQLLLFQGTLIMIFGMSRTVSYAFTWWVLDAINWGNFDQYLLKPYSTLLYIMALTVDHYGIAEALAGLLIVIYSMGQLGMSILSFTTLMYIMFAIAGVLVIVSSQILTAAMGFIAVKSEALMHLHSKLTDFARYPLNIYGIGIKFFLVFLFPMAVSSYVPAQVLIQGFRFNFLLYLIPVMAYFGFALFLWNAAMKKYSSAGG
jgi:ABC-2 type transport system permease protein